MNWKTLKAKVYEKSAEVAQQAADGGKAELFDVEIWRIRDGVWMVGNYNTPNTAKASTSQRAASDCLASTVLDEMMEIMRPLPDDEFQTKLIELHDQIS